jgi:N-acetylglucosamine-6-phosphate deacetylase
MAVRANMPSSTIPAGGITKFTNCRLCRDDRLEIGDLWVSSTTGTILSGQTTFFDGQALPDRVIDLGGRIVAPGLIDVQLNGAFGFNFSTLPQDAPGGSYAKCLADVNRQLISTGVTSYLPTLTSQKPQLYQQVLPHLRQRSHWTPDQGAEPLGAHVEGPFLNPTKNGIHDVNVLQEAKNFQDVEECYGAENLEPDQGAIKMITVAPERGEMLNLIPFFKESGIIASIGHSEATFEIASDAVAAGATMITHLFNAMRPLHHRNPGIFGVLGIAETVRRPYFGIIADGIHLHPTAVKIASNLHPEGLILVTDAMHMLGLPNGSYPWANGDSQSRIVKTGPTLHLEGTDKIAGRCVTNLISIVTNY